MIAVIAEMATYETVNFIDVGASVAGTLIFLAFSLTMGRSLVARLIRWSSGHMTTEVPVITVILLVVLVMTLSAPVAVDQSALELAGLLSLIRK